jgi:hypothetical protein
MQVDDPVVEVVEDDVAAVLGDRRTHPSLEQFLDLNDDVAIRLASLRGTLGTSVSRSTGRPAVKCSMMIPRIAGLS